MAKIAIQDAWKILRSTLMPTEEGFRGVPSQNIGLFQLLVSPANIAASQVKLGTVRSVEKSDGKVYKMARTFNPRIADYDQDQQVIYCPEGGESVKPKTDEVDIPYVHASRVFEINDELLRCIEQGKAGYQDYLTREYLRTYLNALGEKVANLVANQKVGNFYNCDCDTPADTVRTLPLYRSDGQSINPVGEYILDRDRRDLELMDNFILVGNSKLNAYLKYHELQTGNDNGVNAGLLDITRSIYYDTNLGAAWGDPDCILAMAPGALQFINYAENQGDFDYSDQFDDYMKTTVVDPYFGLRHDVIMRYVKCQRDVKLTIQFYTHWNVVGMPDCWSEDCHFDGVNDVFKYQIVCSDEGICDVEQNCGTDRSPGVKEDNFCTSAEPCEDNCQAGFGSDCNEYARFVEALTLTDANAILINGTMDIGLSKAYNLTDATDSAAFIAELKDKLSAVGGIALVSGSFAAATTTLNIFGSPLLTSVVVKSLAGANVDMAGEVANFLHIYDNSTPSGCGTITDLAWTTPNTSFNGAPGAAIPAATANYYGDYDNFFAETTETGAYQLVITDDNGCSDTANDVSASCA